MNSQKFSPNLRLLIIGGVAAGASCAARARRLSETAEITILERGPDVSFANCGLPYFVGGEITNRSSLQIHTPQTLESLLRVAIRTQTEAVRIDRAEKRVAIRTVGAEDTAWLPYDKLLLAPGAIPLRPPLPGINHPQIFTLRNLQDMDRIKAAAEEARKAVVIGAGFIGLEMAEQLRHRHLEVDLVELLPQVLPQMDAKMTLLLQDELIRHGIRLHLGEAVESFAEVDSQVQCRLSSGKTLPADLVILSIGIKPDTKLAAEAGLALGKRGHILVNQYQQTSDPDIYAAGDAVETSDLVSGGTCSVPLGGPANRQGRIVADHIFHPGPKRPYAGSLGTAIVRVFDVCAAMTGWTEKRLQATGRAYGTVTVNDNHHAGYYPGARPITLKILWDLPSGKLLGAEAVGHQGVDKRIDVLATAIAGGLRYEDLSNLELCYAPPFGSAKDIVNLAGFTACNKMDGLFQTADEIDGDPQTQIVDVRPKPLFDRDPTPGAINIPLPQLRSRLGELDPRRPVLTVCAFGKTSYFAARILSQHGFQVRSLSGGIKAQNNPRIPAKLATS